MHPLKFTHSGPQLSVVEGVRDKPMKKGKKKTQNALQPETNTCKQTKQEQSSKTIFMNLTAHAQHLGNTPQIQTTQPNTPH